MPLVKVSEAATVFKHLNGIINVFKPAGVSVPRVRAAILHNICKDLNEIAAQEPHTPQSQQPLLEPGGAANPILRKLESINFAEHVLCTGPRYQIADIKCATVASLGKHTSGVLLFGINRGLKQSIKIQRNRPIRAYHVHGRLGKATESHFPDSHVTVRADYRHVYPERLSALASSLQASHQRKMFELCGVDLQSQAAYEIACKGLVRPSSNVLPIIYNIKLIEFKRPNFTLEIHAINEDEQYLATLIHEIGIELRTVAHCTGLRCIRHAHFGVETALLRHSWNLPAIMRNLREQREILEKHPQILEQERVELHG